MRLAMLKKVLRRKRKKKKKNRRRTNNPPQKSKPQAATSGGLPNWGQPQGRNTNIHHFIGPAKGVKKSVAPHINIDSSPLPVLMFFT
jgi:hypothetical protein